MALKMRGGLFPLAHGLKHVQGRIIEKVDPKKGWESHVAMVQSSSLIFYPSTPARYLPISDNQPH